MRDFYERQRTCELSPKNIGSITGESFVTRINSLAIKQTDIRVSARSTSTCTYHGGTADNGEPPRRRRKGSNRIPANNHSVSDERPRLRVPSLIHPKPIFSRVTFGTHSHGNSVSLVGTRRVQIISRMARSSL